MKRKPAAEHYSWNLGTPDNAIGTEVIVNPYATVMKNRAAVAPQDQLRDIHPLDLKAAYAPHLSKVNPYKSSMSVNIDGKEVLLPTVDPRGREMSEDEAIKSYIQTGKSLGEFDTPEDATKYTYEEAMRRRSGP